MDIESEISILFEMKRLCVLYIDMSSDNSRSENPVMINVVKTLASVKDRLSHFCNHSIVEDLIEVGDSIKRVCYCKHCETNF